MPIPIVDVSDWEVVGQEPSGADAKEWLAPTESAFGASTSDWWLFKSGKFGTRTAKGGEESQYRRGEDWAEKLAEVCARALGLPCAEIELALWNGDEGVISRNVRPDGTVLYSGDVMLSDFDGYVPCASKRKMKERPGHSLANIQELLRGHSGPMGSGCDERDGFDVFAGYLVLDAWIANTDRHAVNWAVTLDDDAMRLASTFDHGSALASGLEDALRERFLEGGIGGWVRKGVAQRFEGGRNVSLVDLAHQAVDMAGPSASQWIERLADLDPSIWRSSATAMPRMSEVASRFAVAILDENRERLCNVNRNRG